MTFRNVELKRRNEKIEQESACQLENGHPIILVDTLDSLAEIINVLRKGKEKIFGIDAEWRPHFLSATEKYFS